MPIMTLCLTAPRVLVYARLALHLDEPCQMTTPEIVQDIVAGRVTHHVVTHGRSQYSGAGGPSACGLAAMNCARVVLLKERAGMRGSALLEEMMKESTADVSV